MRRRDLRLVPVAIAAWASALASVLAPEAAVWIAVGAWAACGLALVAAWRTGNGLVAILVVAVAAAGACASHVAITQPDRAQAVRELDGSVRDLEVRVTTKVEPGALGLRFSGETADGAPVAVRWGGAERAPDGLDMGSRATIAGRAFPASPGDAAAVVVQASEVRVTAPPPGPLAAASDLRRGFVEQATAILPEPGAGLLPGLSVGETSAVSAELDEAMRATSLSHLTAVSGSNCALVVGIAYALLAACGVPRAGRIAGAVVALGGFVLLVTPEASVIRAAAMSVIGMLALLLGRAGAGVAVLSLAIICLMVADPWLAASYGFLLSAAATGALLLLAEPLARGLGRIMPRALALGVAVPLAAQVVCGPIIVLFAPEVSISGVVANMIAAPAAPIATVLGLVACLGQALSPVTWLASWVAWIPAAWVAQTARTFSSLPGAGVPWREGWWGSAALAGIGAAVVVVIASRSPRLRALRRLCAAGLSLVAGVGVGAAALAGPVAGPLTAPRDWVLAMCDVGQGDALLVRSDDAVALVDTGPEEPALRACLDRLGVDRIDLLVLTHFDLDHVGGAGAIAGRVDLVLHGPVSEERDRATLDALGARHVEQAHAGMTGSLGGARWRVLWPREGTRAFEPGNDTSAVVEFSGGGVPRSLLLGDLSEDAQRLLATGGARGRYEVVKVSHHGSRDQFDGLYERAAPAVALIGVGENDYGHPHPDILRALADVGAVVGRTDVDGLVLVGSDDGALTVWRERRAPARRCRRCRLPWNAWPQHDVPRRSPRRSRSSRGDRPTPRRSCSCPAPKRSAPSGRPRPCASS